jgi:hypothetical protein
VRAILLPDMSLRLCSTTTEITNYYAKGKYVKMDPSMITTPWLCMTRPGFEVGLLWSLLSHVLSMKRSP